MPGPRVSVTSTRAVVAAAQRRGVDAVALLAHHSVSPSVLEDPDARLEATLVHSLWTDATAQSGEPLLPVYAALELPWGPTVSSTTSAVTPPTSAKQPGCLPRTLASSTTPSGWCSKRPMAAPRCELSEAMAARYHRGTSTMHSRHVYTVCRRSSGRTCTLLCPFVGQPLRTSAHTPSRSGAMYASTRKLTRSTSAPRSGRLQAVRPIPV